MAAKWKDVRRGHAPKVERASQQWVRREVAKIPLAQLRKARSMTQMSLARLLNVNQAAISQMEGRSDMYLSTLRSYIEALGGSLEIRAKFAEGEICLERMSDLTPPSPGQKTVRPSDRRSPSSAKGKKKPIRARAA